MKPAIPAGGLGLAAARLPGLQTVWDKGYRGEGVGVAVLDSGVAPLEDFGDRLVAWQDMTGQSTEPVDTHGHGTIAAGCAAGDGLYKGVAPQANLIGVRVASDDDVEDGLRWVIANKDRYKIRVINMSLGVAPGSSGRLERLCRQAVEAGLVICASMGNDFGIGPAAFPASFDSVIGVGAYDDKGTATLADDDVASFSNRGDRERLPNKPDVLAPGVGLRAPVPPDSQLGRDSRDGYLATRGTSEATPYVAGLVALLLQAVPTMEPGEVVQVLRDSASGHLARERWEQGAGLVQADVALELALERDKAKRTFGTAGSSHRPFS